VSNVEREISTQPETWRRAAALAREGGPALPPAGVRLAVIGCGTSLYIGQAFAELRERGGQGETDAFPASAWPLARSYGSLLAISRSGTTTEILDALSASPADLPSAALTATPDSPVLDAAAAHAVLEFADEQALVQTRFATTVLALLRAHLREDVEALAAAAEAELAAPLPVDPREFEHFVFIGAGWGTALAHEAALKLRETAGVWTESYAAMEYRHGPVSATTPSTLLWALGPGCEDVLKVGAEAGATTVSGGDDALVDLLAAQRAGVELAKQRGLDPDSPRHLARSVILN